MNSYFLDDILLLIGNFSTRKLFKSNIETLMDLWSPTPTPVLYSQRKFEVFFIHIYSALLIFWFEVSRHAMLDCIYISSWKWLDRIVSFTLTLVTYLHSENLQDPATCFFSIADSIVYVTKPGQPNPPTGNFLGDLTDELKPGQFITEFVSLGACTL
jgi:hypothetical protein